MLVNTCANFNKLQVSNKYAKIVYHWTNVVDKISFRQLEKCLIPISFTDIPTLLYFMFHSYFINLVFMLNKSMLTLQSLKTLFEVTSSCVRILISPYQYRADLNPGCVSIYLNPESYKRAARYKLIFKVGEGGWQLAPS